MRIAFVYDAIYPWIKGGAERRIYELGKRLASQGNEVHVFGVKWWSGADIIENEGMILHGVCGPMELYVNGRRSISLPVIFSIKLLSHLSRGEYDVIDVSAFPYFSCFSAKFVSILRRKTIIITWHEVWGEYWYDYMGRAGFFGKLVENMVSKLTSKSITVSGMTKKDLESLGVAAENIYVVPNGIDLKRIASIPPSDHKCDMIFAGRLIRDKNVDILIEAVDSIRRELPDVKCHIIGSGPEKERLIRIATEHRLQDNVSFFEFMEYDEVIARIKSSKVLVLPSTREGFGMVVLEAFACGVPVVTVKSKHNAASGLVNRETGFAVDLDAGELCNAIRTLIIDGMLRERMSTSAIDAAQGYDWDKIVMQLAYVYKELK